MKKTIFIKKVKNNNNYYYIFHNLVFYFLLFKKQFFYFLFLLRVFFLLYQNQIATFVFKNVTNDTSGKQINPLNTFVKILLGVLVEHYVTLTHDMVHLVSKRHVTWYLDFQVPRHINKKLKKKRKESWGWLNHPIGVDQPPRLA